METRRKKRSRNARERNLETIPFDLLIEILRRLPVKSIGRYRCVSKLWESTIRSPIFTEPFFTTSLSRPKLLFTGQLDGKTFFFSSVSPQPLNSSTLTASFHMKFPIDYPYDICRPVRGLVCGQNQRIVEGKTITVSLVCNPSTGQFITLPKVKTKSKQVINYLGYDPIGKKFKVLCITNPSQEKQQVLTLGTGKELSWRKIKCDIPHDPLPLEYRDNHRGVYDGMCINGVCYYFAWLHHIADVVPNIVSFDIRSEKFKCIIQADDMRYYPGSFIESTLVNYKGKLAKVQLDIVDQKGNSCIWVLQDPEKHQWLKYIYVLPHPWKNIVKPQLCFVGMTSMGEIVLSRKSESESFYFLYFNPERNSVKRVEIQGMEAFKHHKVYTFFDHVEDVKLM